MRGACLPFPTIRPQMGGGGRQVGQEGVWLDLAVSGGGARAAADEFEQTAVWADALATALTCRVCARGLPLPGSRAEGPRQGAMA